jgi:hypothetical protein
MNHLRPRWKAAWKDHTVRDVDTKAKSFDSTYLEEVGRLKRCGRVLFAISVSEVADQVC